MHGLNAFEYLEGEGFEVLVSERLLGLDDAMEVTVHQLHHHVQLGLLFEEREIVEGNHIRMRAEKLHESNLS